MAGGFGFPEGPDRDKVYDWDADAGDWVVVKPATARRMAWLDLDPDQGAMYNVNRDEWGIRSEYPGGAQ